MNFRWPFFTMLAITAVAAGVMFRFVGDWDRLASNVSYLGEVAGRQVQRSAADSHYIDSSKLTSLSEQKISDLKNSYIKENKRFVLADLKKMKLWLYDEDGKTAEMMILTKGREGSWWETVSGSYAVIGKERNHFSSIGKVWQPWSVQFYGNFFIHGWPYYEDGTPVASTFSGGCVRLSTEDAKKLYDFVEKGTPVLVLDESDSEILPAKPLLTVKSLELPELSAQGALVADLSNGDIMLNKNGEAAMPIASLTKLMTAVVASELIYLERSITITPYMLSAAIQSFSLRVGEQYIAFDLLYPLLMQSSNGAASAIAGFLGERDFVKNMNIKAESLSMKDTVFDDPSGVSEKNISTPKDLIKLTNYILEKRYFIFDITKGKNYLRFGPLKLGGVKNFNEFAEEENLIGVKNGETKAARQAMLTVWRFRAVDGLERKIAIIVLESEQRQEDTEKILAWLQESFGLK